MKQTIHIISYGSKSIPITYNPEEVQCRLLEINQIITKCIDYMNKSKISLTDKQRRLLIAEECISTSYIEGYEVYLSNTMLADGYRTNDLAGKATLACFNAYNFALEKYLETSINSTSDILDIWKQLVKYKIFFRKNIRNIGVRVGNRFSTSHIAPPARYVRKLLDEMFNSLSQFNTIQEDEYNLLKPIILHYIYTFIHPFLDGNGRTARLFEQLMILHSNKDKGFDFMVPLSTIILEDKRAYYNTFKSRQTFGIDCTDVLSADITDFINYNLYTIESGLLRVMRELDTPIKSNIDITEMHKLNKRQQIMLEYIKLLVQGISIHGYKKIWNNILSTKQQLPKISKKDAKNDLEKLLDLDLIVYDPRYTLYPGFKYYNK